MLPKTDPHTTRTSKNQTNLRTWFDPTLIWAYIYITTFLDSTTFFVYNYKPANFEEDFISALTALVTAQDDPQRLKELTEGAKSILNNETMGLFKEKVDYLKELPNVLKQVKWIFFSHLLTYSLQGLVML